MGLILPRKLLALACLGSLNAYARSTWASEYSLATSAYERGDYAEAEKHDRAALSSGASFPENDLRLEAILSQLVAVLQARGACCEAETFMRRALAIREAHFGSDSIETATGQANLAAVLLQNGHGQEARRLSTEALATAERVLDPNSTQLMQFLAQAALSEQKALQFDRAEKLLTRARVLAENDATTDPRRRMQVWRYFGGLYRASGRFDEAEQAYKNLLLLTESKPGGYELETATALTGLGDALCQRKFFAAAQPNLQRAVDIFQRIQETGVPSYITALQDLASAELYLGQGLAAEQHALLVIETMKKQTGANDEALAVAYANLGQVYAIQRRFREAEQATLRAKEILVAIEGAESAKIAAVISNLGALCVQQHKYAKAQAYYDESARIDSKVLGPESTAYARDLNRLGVLYNYQKRFAESEEVLRKALTIDTKALGADSPVLADPYVNLANSLHGQRRLEDSLECFRKAIGIMANAGQRDAPSMANILDQYAGLLREMQRWADAEKASVDALGIRVKESINPQAFH